MDINLANSITEMLSSLEQLSLAVESKIQEIASTIDNSIEYREDKLAA
jgi:hypothetical protein